MNFLDALAGFEPRGRRYNFLRYQSDVSDLDAPALGDEFAKEHVRVTFQTRYLAETADVDGIFWGRRHTYPVEIKEKTAASDRQVGEYFGLDIGPFVKLAFYAAMRGNLHSLFIVREIDNENDRNLVNWWYITFERLAQFASWVSVGGGRSMGGGLSTTVRIPKSKFQILDAAALARL